MISVKVRLVTPPASGRTHSLRVNPCTRSRLRTSSDTLVSGLVGSDREYDSPGSNCSRLAFKLMVFNLSPPIATYAALTRSTGAAAGTARTRSRRVPALMPTAQHKNIVKYRPSILLRIDVPPLSCTAESEFQTALYRKMPSRVFEWRAEYNKPIDNNTYCFFRRARSCPGGLLRSWKQHRF